ncbi:hypothetical protein [uncultured Campylobacter sp.]|nr:hypothetical protein [uncultured Campylobacter sp.]
MDRSKAHICAAISRVYNAPCARADTRYLRHVSKRKFKLKRIEWTIN